MDNLIDCTTEQTSRFLPSARHARHLHHILSRCCIYSCVRVASMDKCRREYPGHFEQCIFCVILSLWSMGPAPTSSLQRRDIGSTEYHSQMRAQYVPSGNEL